MALEIELVLLEPGDVEFLPRGAALELASDVFLVVSDNSKTSSAFHCKPKKEGLDHFVMIPVVLTPSVLCVTRNLPCSLMGL